MTSRKIMKIILKLVLAAAVAFIACGGSAGIAPANSMSASPTNAAAKSASTAPTKEALMALEKSGWEAWKNNDMKWFVENTAAYYKGFSANGYVDKAGSIKSLTEAKCVVKSYSISDEQMHMAGPDAAFLTFRAAQDATCNGKRSPANVYSVSVYFRDGDKWNESFYAESPAVDPKAPHAKPAAKAPDKKNEAAPAEFTPDAATEALFAVETKA